jgi:glutaredoxin
MANPRPRRSLLLLCLAGWACGSVPPPQDPYLEAQAIERHLLRSQPGLRLSDPDYLRVARSLREVPRNHPKRDEAREWLRAIEDARRVHLGTLDPRYSPLPERLRSAPVAKAGELSAAADGALPTVGTPITLFSASWCTACKRARSWLEQNNIAFREVDVEATREGRREFQQLAGAGSPVPVIQVPGQEPIVGFRPRAIRRALAASGSARAPSSEAP